MADSTGSFQIQIQTGPSFLAPPLPGVMGSPVSSLGSPLSALSPMQQTRSPLGSPSQAQRPMAPSSPSPDWKFVPNTPPTGGSPAAWMSGLQPPDATGAPAVQFPHLLGGAGPASFKGGGIGGSIVTGSAGGGYAASPGGKVASCPSCGMGYQDDSTFCTGCGHQVQTSVRRLVSGTPPSSGAPTTVVRLTSGGPPAVLSDGGAMIKVLSDGATPVTKVPSGSTATTFGSGSSLGGGKVSDEWDAEVSDVCRRIDTDGNGFISKLELIAAVQNDSVVASFVLPGKDSSQLMSDEETFDQVDAVFDEIACGKQRLKYADFASHFRKAAGETTSNGCEMRAIYDLIDADGNGSISKLELVAAVQGNSEVAAFLLPGLDSGKLMRDEKAFDAINSMFESIAGGKRRIDFSDFESYFKKVTCLQPRQRVGRDRKSTRVFIIGPGFGLQLNPRQAAMITNEGYQVHWCHGIPNPETPLFPVQQYLDFIKAEIDAFQPDVVCCASKGGVYMVGLWQSGYWRGPSVLINAHPTCKQLPEGVQVVLAQGGNDEVYPTPRSELERIIATGTDNRSFLYYVANSGLMPSGQHTRRGDFHNMESLLSRDTLPRLIDATLCPEGPEVHMVRSWRERLSETRVEAELALGYSPERLRKRWATRGMDDQKLHDVARGSEEWNRVAAVFKAAPKEQPAYALSPQATWDRVQILSIQRVENGLQLDGSTKPYYDSLRRTLEDQGVEFEPGTHTCWAFHGASNEAIESIISNPLAGFQPLASGTRNSNVWGSGTYFARDAKYVADGGFCGQPSWDGTRRMLMCLLMTGMPCLGDPAHKGVLPFRNKPHRYNSSVDSLSSPEIFIVQHPGSALPGYLITFA